MKKPDHTVTSNEAMRLARQARCSVDVVLAVACGEPGPSDLERHRVLAALVAHGLLKQGAEPCGVRVSEGVS